MTDESKRRVRTESFDMGYINPLTSENKQNQAGVTMEEETSF
jgi:hypothetical protein